MGKLSTYLITMSGIIIISYAFGLLQNTFTSAILNVVFNPTSAETSALFQFLLQPGTGFIALALSIVVTAIVQVTKNDFMIIAPIVAVLLNFMFDFLAIFQVIAAATHTIVATMIFSPLIVLYFFTVIEWWRGITT